MACDIHFYVERREGGKWVEADKWVVGEDWWNKGEMVKDTNFYDERNYRLFAILAGVRNRRGSGDASTDEGFSPISLPKGLPEDVSPLVSKASASWDGEGHSHSYLTLRELLDYDWTQISYYKKAQTFLFISDVMPRLRQLGEPDDVRIVFWFDN